MALTRRLALLTPVACLALAVVGCDRQAKREPEHFRQLNEIPIAQLRVMIKGFPGEWRPASDRHRWWRKGLGRHWTT